jgi:hypothetical protein
MPKRLPKLPTQAQFVQALKRVPKPKGRQLDFLREHVQALGRAQNASGLADAVGYKSHDGINLQYGLLARRIGEELGISGAGLTLLVDFIRPGDVTNAEWVMVMHPQFAEALKQAGWV